MIQAIAGAFLGGTPVSEPLWAEFVCDRFSGGESSAEVGFWPKRAMCTRVWEGKEASRYLAVCSKFGKFWDRNQCRRQGLNPELIRLENGTSRTENSEQEV